MKDQKLREKILEKFEEPIYPKLIPRNPSVGINAYTFLISDLRDFFIKEFDDYWSIFELNYDLQEHYIKTLGINKLQGKKVERELYFNLFKYLYLGKLYELAKGNYEEPELEQSIDYDEKNGLFRITRNKEILEYLVQNVFFVGFTAISIITPEKHKKEEEYEKILTDYRDLIQHSDLQSDKIKKLIIAKRKLIEEAKKPLKNELIRLVNQARKKNGKINYSRVAKELGRTHHTIKSWCIEYGIV